MSEKARGLAEGMGFEPTIGVSPYNGLAIRHRPSKKYPRNGENLWLLRLSGERETRGYGGDLPEVESRTGAQDDGPWRPYPADWYDTAYRPKNQSEAVQVQLLRSTGRLPKPPTFVYFMLADGLLKIGISQNVEQRRRGLESQSGRKLDVLGYIKGDRDLERSWHERYASYREHGEWFRADNDLLADAIATVVESGSPLEWCTRSENERHKVALRLARMSTGNDLSETMDAVSAGPQADGGKDE